jgi:hypothetical protein
MKKQRKYEARIELRIDSKLRDKFESFCKDRELNKSIAGRDALAQYMNEVILRDIILSHIQEKKFYQLFKSFYRTLPVQLKKSFDNLLEQEEVKLVMDTPVICLKNIKVLTEKGEKALQSKKAKQGIENV